MLWVPPRSKTICGVVTAANLIVALKAPTEERVTDLRLALVVVVVVVALFFFLPCCTSTSFGVRTGTPALLYGPY